MKQGGIFAIIFLALCAAMAMLPNVSAGEEAGAKLTVDQLIDLAAQPDVLARLAAQPDLTISHDASLIPNEHGGFWVNAEIAIPLPAEMGGGYLVGTEEALRAGLAATDDDNGGSTLKVTIKKAGTGTGTVTSSPLGINCGKTCTTTTKTFDSAKVKKLVFFGTSPDATSLFAGWSGGPCTGTKPCTISTISGSITVTATFTTLAHIVPLPSKKDFGKTTVGQTTTQIFNMVSSGYDTLKVGAVTLSGTGAKLFSIKKNGCASAKLNWGDQCSITVAFTPTAAASYTASLNVASNDRKTPALAIPISGTGVK